MRRILDPQSEFDFEPSNLKVTNEYYAKYAVISSVLDANPIVLELVHGDLARPLK